MNKWLSALLGVVASLPTPAAAYDSRDLLCGTIRRTADGLFTNRMEPGLSVRAMIMEPGPFVQRLGPDVVAFICFRDQVMPEVDDVEVLQAGYSLYLGSSRTGVRMIKLELVGGRVRFEAMSGNLNGGERRSLAQIVEQMQARLVPAP